MKQTQVFISYSHKDSEWLEKLRVMLKPAENKYRISIWDDSKITPGEEWKEAISKALDTANVAVLLVSADFLASNFIAKNELPKLLNAAKRKKLKLLWIYLNYCDYKSTEIANYQAAHDISRPLKSLTESEQYQVLLEVCNLITLFDNGNANTQLTESISETSEPKIIKVNQGSVNRLLKDNFNQSSQNYSQAPIFDFETIVIDVYGKEKKQYRRQKRYRSESMNNGIVLELVAIPRGKLIMGSPDSELGRKYDESPQHLVTLGAFLVGKYPITQAQWSAVARLPKFQLDLDVSPACFTGAKLPVEGVSWYEAQEFCARLSQFTGKEYRLPSEAEWEYACRGETETPFHFGETITTDFANYNGEVIYNCEPKGQYRKTTTEVGSFQVANNFGLYDMHGNVGEWCLDYWHENYQEAPQDGSAWLTGGDNYYRLIRGGSWSLYAKYCRSANRSKNKPSLKSSRIGFRVVCSSSQFSK